MKTKNCRKCRFPQFLPKFIYPICSADITLKYPFRSIKPEPFTLHTRFVTQDDTKCFYGASCHLSSFSSARLCKKISSPLAGKKIKLLYSSLHMIYHVPLRKLREQGKFKNWVIWTNSFHYPCFGFMKEFYHNMKNISTNKQLADKN